MSEYEAPAMSFYKEKKIIKSKGKRRVYNLFEEIIIIKILMIKMRAFSKRTE